MINSVKDISNPVTVTNKWGVKVAEFDHKAIMVHTLFNNESLRIRHEGVLYKTDVEGTLYKVGETALGKAV